MTLFRRAGSPPQPTEVMPPRPPDCRPPAPAPRWHGAWRSNGPLNAGYDPCGSGPVAARESGEST